MPRATKLDIEIRDSVFDPDSTERVIIYKKGQSREQFLYRVFVYLDGRDLFFAKKVVYVLHPTFPNPIRTISRTPSNPNCKLELWCWGAFTIKAEVRDIEGNPVWLGHELDFIAEMEEARGRGVPFIEADHRSSRVR